MPPRVLGYDDYDAVLWAPMTCGSDGHASGGPGAGITARGRGSWVLACLGKGPIGETFLTLIEFRYIQRVDWKGRLPWLTADTCGPRVWKLMRAPAARAPMIGEYTSTTRA